MERQVSGKGQRIGYIRVSSYDQNPDRQLDGVQLDRKYTDTASGKDTQRPQLQELLDYARDGDTIVVHSMDRLARNVDDLRRIVQHQTKRGVSIQFVKENLLFTGQRSPINELMLNILGGIAQFERDCIKERQLEGIALAKKRGVYKGRKRQLTPEQVSELCRRIATGDKKAAIARQFGISRETLYQYLRRDQASTNDADAKPDPTKRSNP
jgi:DNA invertase Pin-like site-specific DNA recombinase